MQIEIKNYYSSRNSSRAYAILALQIKNKIQTHTGTGGTLITCVVGGGLTGCLADCHRWCARVCRERELQCHRDTMYLYLHSVENGYFAIVPYHRHNINNNMSVYSKATIVTGDNPARFITYTFNSIHCAFFEVAHNYYYCTNPYNIYI